MILDSPCDIDGCTAHLDLIKADFDSTSLNWIHYYNCLSGHHYIKVSGNLLVNPDEFYESDPPEEEPDEEYYQAQLFDDEDYGDEALD